MISAKKAHICLKIISNYYFNDVCFVCLFAKKEIFYGKIGY
ncbi:hypothetical protein TFKS16_1170 [Tannerella forsythia KS16]|nr:hypothetical protein TFKS16_1170 [Tannerella forsythia KS16]